MSHQLDRRIRVSISHLSDHSTGVCLNQSERQIIVSHANHVMKLGNSKMLQWNQSNIDTPQEWH